MTLPSCFPLHGHATFSHTFWTISKPVGSCRVASQPSAQQHPSTPIQHFGIQHHGQELPWPAQHAFSFIVLHQQVPHNLSWTLTDQYHTTLMGLHGKALHWRRRQHMRRTCHAKRRMFMQLKVMWAVLAASLPRVMAGTREAAVAQSTTMAAPAYR